PARRGSALDQAPRLARVAAGARADPPAGVSPPGKRSPAPDDRRYLDPVLHDGHDLLGDALDHAGGDAQRLVTGERLAGQLDHDTPPRPVHPVSGGSGLSRGLGIAAFRSVAVARGSGTVPYRRTGPACRAVPPVGAVFHDAASSVVCRERSSACLADLEARERPYPGALLAEHLLDRLLGILDERLLDERHVLKERAQ